MLVVWEDDEYGTFVVMGADELTDEIPAPDGGLFGGRANRGDWILLTGNDGDHEAVVNELQKQFEAQIAANEH